MNVILKQPICDNSAWTAETFVNDHTWIYQLTQQEIDDVHQAVLIAKSTGKLIYQLTSNDFPLPNFIYVLSDFKNELENGRETLAVIEVFDQYYIRDAYIGRNSIRLNLLIGMSVMTLILGLVLAVSIAFPLRRLSRKLDKKLTPEDIAVQLQGFRIESLLKRKDEVGRLHTNLVTLTQQVSSLFKEKEQFASEVAHELKNPNDVEAISKIKAQAIRMSRLVNEISEAAIR